MGRWSWEDSDEARLPEGMQRVGYDADTQIYSYRDWDGSYWEGDPGARYGVLHRSDSGYQPMTIDDEKAAHKGNSEVRRSVTSSFSLFISWVLEKARKGRELGKERIRKGVKGLGKTRKGTGKEKARTSRKGMERRKERKGIREGRARTRREGTERRRKERARTRREGMERRVKEQQIAPFNIWLNTETHANDRGAAAVDPIRLNQGRDYSLLNTGRDLRASQQVATGAFLVYIML